jgi:2-isopropylmalate synthase
MPVHPRHPWAGDLVYAAFSGSHQDAIRKSMAFHSENSLPKWKVAYLPIDPRDIGRSYDEVVRINSQSGKGGVALVLERDHGIIMPTWLHPIVSELIQQRADTAGIEVSPAEVWDLFYSHFLKIPDGWLLNGYDTHSVPPDTHAEFRINTGTGPLYLKGSGQGLLEALADAMLRHFDVRVTIIEFNEHSLTPGTGAKAIASVRLDVDGDQVVACCIHEDSSLAALQATLSAIGRSRFVNCSELPSGAPASKAVGATVWHG